MLAPVVIDFETDAIASWRAPRPVGVAVWVPGTPPRYLAWGHPTGNNTTFAHAKEVLGQIVNGHRDVLFHNAAFDLGVLEQHCGLTLADAKVHDTMLLAFLADPNATELGLKSLAARWCGMPPEEQDALRDYDVQHRLIPRSKKSVGEVISQIPGDVVAPYALGDVIRTRKLWGKLARYRGQAYDRKRRVMHLMRENTRLGVRVAATQLEEDTHSYGDVLTQADESLRSLLGAEHLNLDANDDVAEALSRCGEVTEWTLTAKSQKRSMAKGVLTLEKFKRPEVGILYLYRQRLATCLSTFLGPWCEHAQEDGRVHPQWNIVASVDGGTRTGRFSSREPNFQNIPRVFKEAVPEGFPSLPTMRRYLLPEPGQTWHCRDYAQQEFRILAHYEDGPLLEAYRSDPHLNMHAHIGTLLTQITGREWDKAHVKQADFGYLYGIGPRKLAAMLSVPEATAYTLIDALRDALPGVEALKRHLHDRAMAGMPFTVHGGAKYRSEPPRVVDGRLRDFYYKDLNTLIQASAAACTEEALIAYHDHPKRQGRMLVPVHDEINVSGDEAEMSVLQDAMESVRFDVPMLTEGMSGPSWGEIQ